MLFKGRKKHTNTAEMLDRKWVKQVWLGKNYFDLVVSVDTYNQIQEGKETN